MTIFHIFFCFLLIIPALSAESIDESLYLESSFALSRAQEYLNSHSAKMPEYYFCIENCLSEKQSRQLLKQFSEQLTQNQDLSYQDRCAKLLQCRAAEPYSAPLAQWQSSRILSQHYTNDFLEFSILYSHALPIKIQNDIEQNAPFPAQRLYAKICNKQIAPQNCKNTTDFLHTILPSDYQKLPPIEIYWKIRCLAALKQLGWINSEWEGSFLEYFLRYQKGDGSWNHSPRQSVWMTLALMRILK